MQFCSEVLIDTTKIYQSQDEKGEENGENNEKNEVNENEAETVRYKINQN